MSNILSEVHPELVAEWSDKNLPLTPDMENKVLAVITPDTILQDDYIQAVRSEGLGDYLQPEEKADSAEAPAFDIGMGYLGNGLTVWNRAVEENGDYQTIAHISSEGEIRYYVDGLPDDVVSRIEQAAAREQQKALFSAAYKVGDRVYLDGKPFEITRVDDWNVELMDRSVQNPQPRLEQKDSFMRLVQQNERSGFTDTYRQYSEIKSANPDSLVLYQMGDFFEAYGADAQTVSEALELNLASRSIGGNQRIQMCGFPANHLETYVNMLLDRGFDVVVSSLENGERSTRNIVSTNKEDPVQSKPVGRIDYLHTDGTVRESVEYTSPYQFEKDIKEENYYGVPFTVVFYQWTSVKDQPHVIKRLTVGEEYTLREEMAPYGYLKATDVKFTLKDTAEIQKVEMKDEVPTGLLIINKYGEFLDKVTLLDQVKGTVEHLFEYVTGSLSDVTFDVFAAEDIKAADGVSEDYFKADEKVGTITTDSNGIAQMGDLPAGKYYVKEVKTAHGYVLDGEPRYVDLSYRDQDTPVITYDEKWQNARQKVKVTVLKKEKDTERVLAGGVFGLYRIEKRW